MKGARTQPPSHTRYYRSCGKGVWEMAVRPLVHCSNAGALKYNVKRSSAGAKACLRLYIS